VVKNVKEREILQRLNPLASILFLLVAEVLIYLFICLFVYLFACLLYCAVLYAFCMEATQLSGAGWVRVPPSSIEA
jgi:hypothetical protein